MRKYVIYEPVATPEAIEQNFGILTDTGLLFLTGKSLSLATYGTIKDIIDVAKELSVSDVVDEFSRLFTDVSNGDIVALRASLAYAIVKNDRLDGLPLINALRSQLRADYVSIRHFSEVRSIAPSFPRGDFYNSIYNSNITNYISVIYAVHSGYRTDVSEYLDMLYKSVAIPDIKSSFNNYHRSIVSESENLVRLCWSMALLNSPVGEYITELDGVREEFNKYYEYTDNREHSIVCLEYNRKYNDLRRRRSDEERQAEEIS